MLRSLLCFSALCFRLGYSDNDLATGIQQESKREGAEASLLRRPSLRCKPQTGAEGGMGGKTGFSSLCQRVQTGIEIGLQSDQTSLGRFACDPFLGSRTLRGLPELHSRGTARSRRLRLRLCSSGGSRNCLAPAQHRWPLDQESPALPSRNGHTRPAPAAGPAG